MSTITISEIEQAAKELSDNSRELFNIQSNINRQIEDVKESNYEELQKAIIKTAESKQLLLTLVTDAKHLFEKKKTLTYGTVKVGYVKGKDKLVITSQTATINLIRELMPELAKTAIKTEESVVMNAIKNMDKQELAKIGAYIDEGTETPTVELSDSELKKLIDKLIEAYAKRAE